MGYITVQCKYDYEYDGNGYCEYCYNKIKPEIETIKELHKIIDDKLNPKIKIMFLKYMFYWWLESKKHSKRKQYKETIS